MFLAAHYLFYAKKTVPFSFNFTFTHMEHTKLKPRNDKVKKNQRKYF